MREKAAAEAMLTPVTKEKSALPTTVAMARRPGRLAQQAVNAAVDVGYCSRFADKFTHQHETAG